MSLAQTMREMETANKALEGQVAAMKAETDKAAQAAKDTIAKAMAQVSEKDARVKGLSDQLAAAAQAADEAAKAHVALEAKAAQLADELGKARAALANPAFVDAAASGQQRPPKDPGETRTEQAAEQFFAAYQAEKDPAKRSQMWRDRVR